MRFVDFVAKIISYLSAAVLSILSFVYTWAIISTSPTKELPELWKLILELLKNINPLVKLALSDFIMIAVILSLVYLTLKDGISIRLGKFKNVDCNT